MNRGRLLFRLMLRLVVVALLASALLPAAAFAGEALGEDTGGQGGIATQLEPQQESQPDQQLAPQPDQQPASQATPQPAPQTTLQTSPQLAPQSAAQEVFKFEVTVGAGDEFEIGTGRYAQGTFWPFDWSINWGEDPQQQDIYSGAAGAPSITKQYANGGTYTVTITPNGSPDAWLAAFDVSGSQYVTAIVSEFTPLMCRPSSLLAEPDPANLPGDEFAGMFKNCSKLTNTGPGFQSAWDDVRAVGPNFAAYMFANCGADAFAISNDFNLPQSIIAAGDYFASNMFYECSGSDFTMGDALTMPQSLVTVGDGFAYSMFNSCFGNSFNMGAAFDFPQRLLTAGSSFGMMMFYSCGGNEFTMGAEFNFPQGLLSAGSDFGRGMFAYCDGAAFTMNSVVNLPQSITADDGNFANEMFYYCKGDAFTMNDVFTLPQSLESAGNNFARWMFEGCRGSAFNMGAAFNIPQQVSTVGDNFCSFMFFGCNGPAFTMNDVFTFPQSIQAVGEWFIEQMFYDCNNPAFMINDVFVFPRFTPAQLSSGMPFQHVFGSLAGAQRRSAISVINNPSATPDVAPYTLIPHTDSYTFQSAFADIDLIHTYWGGGGQDYEAVVTFDANGTALAFDGAASTAESYVRFGSRVATPALDKSGVYRLVGWCTDATCTDDWDLLADTVTSTASINATNTLYAKAIGLLLFADSPDFDIQAGSVGAAVAPVSVASGVSGGAPGAQGQYAFSASGLPAGLVIDPQTGVISGTPTTACAAGVATITVTDFSCTVQPQDSSYPDQSATITISYGAIAPAASVSPPATSDTGTVPDSGTVPATGDGAAPLAATAAALACAGAAALIAAARRRRAAVRGLARKKPA